MPLYEYECQNCGHRHERIEKHSGPNLKKCPDCGGKLDRVVTAPAIQFKGSGWYVTDYAGKPSGDSSKSEQSDSKDGKEKKEGKETKEARVSKDSKSDSSSTDSKPAKKT